MPNRLQGVTIALLLAGCTFGSAGDLLTARKLAKDYMTALEGGRADRGWSLILPDSRRAYRNQGQYMELVEAVDWEPISWKFAETTDDYCEDGGNYCAIRLEIAGAPASLPTFLLEAPQSRADDRLFTLLIDDDPASTGNAQIVVYFDASGNRGILLGGG